ncbi:MAG: NADH:flavin oxidoreductase/NADH oxidase family protein [Phaeodactylibacter sp.]|nr:NADH:flavin oxidoreductase/NADH oxidase family protein [Phaeodactylibacter sp.]MCB9051715.1 NADH:flavin oxidoreductase/NADH oxidase family protein [Lewinellaceae bacterium]
MLTTSLTLPCGATLRNRLAKAALTERLSRADYLPNELHRRLYQSWAEQGPGLMLTGNIMVDKRYLESAGNVAVEDESALPALQQWTQAGKANGQHLWAQLSHPGRQCSILVTLRPLAPSAVKLKKLGLFAKPRAMTEAEIEEVIQRFVRTAGLCKEGGFTGIQIHAAHGYLLSQFLSPRTNRRTDAWGGALENRARLLMTILRETRQALGSDFPIGVKLNSADFQRGGFVEEDALQVVRWLTEAGVDLLEVSGGTYEHLAFLVMDETGVKESTRRREAYFLDFARKVRQVSDVPLMVTGGFRSRSFAEEALERGELDVIGMGRPFLTEPGQVGAFLRGELERFSNLKVRTGFKNLEDMAEGGFYARQLILLARGKALRLDMSPLAAALFVPLHEMRKALGKRF